MKEQRGCLLSGTVTEHGLLLAESGVTFGVFLEKNCQNDFCSSVTFFIYLFRIHL